MEMSSSMIQQSFVKKAIHRLNNNNNNNQMQHQTIPTKVNDINLPVAEMEYWTSITKKSRFLLEVIFLFDFVFFISIQIVLLILHKM